MLIKGNAVLNIEDKANQFLADMFIDKRVDLY